MHKKIIKKLEKRLSLPLPGWEAQQRMSPILTTRYREQKSGSKKAAVMLLLYVNSENRLSLIYIKRPKHNPNDKHGGQISFPGGQVDSEDENYRDTALRETFEEIGIDSDLIRVLGEISPIYVFASNFYVQPVVGYLDAPLKLTLQKSEVDYIIETTIEQLIHPSTIQKADFKMGKYQATDMPFYNLNGEMLWGATAMLTAEFLEIYQSLDI